MASGVNERRKSERLSDKESHIDLLDTDESTFIPVTYKRRGKYVNNNKQSAVDMCVTNCACHQKLELLTEELNLVKSLLVKLNNQLLYVENKTVDNVARSMRDNIVINGVSEIDDENCEKEVIGFIKNNLKVNLKTADVIRAHRLGDPRDPTVDDDGNELPNPRPMVAKIDGKMKENIMKNVSKLKDKKGPDNKPLFISTQQPEGITEKRKRVNFRVKQLKKVAKSLPKTQKTPTIKVKNDRIFHNGALVRDKVTVPSIPDVIFSKPDEREKVMKVKLKKSRPIDEDGSTFIGYSLKVTSPSEVQQAYQKVKLLHPDSADVMCAYNITDEFNRPYLEYHDDREHGGGSRILSSLQYLKAENSACFVVRYFNGKHLGPRRFFLIKKVAEDALGHLN